MLRHKIKHELLWKRFLFLFIAICCINLASPLLAQPLKDLRIGNKYVYDLDLSYQNASVITHNGHYPEVHKLMYFEDCIADSIINNLHYTVIYSSFDKSSRLQRSNDTAVFEYQNGKEIIIQKWDVRVLDTISYHSVPAIQSKLNSFNEYFRISQVEKISEGAGSLIRFLASSILQSDSLMLESQNIILKPFGLWKSFIYRREPWRKINLSVPIEINLFNKGRILNSVVLGDTLVQELSIQVPIKAEIINVSAIVGQQANITIRLIGVSRLAELTKQYGCNTGSISLSYNASLLEPISYVPIGSVENGRRKMKLFFDFSGESDTASYSLAFRATIGNAPSTDLRLDTLQVSGKTVSINQITQSGTFTLLGLNMAGNSPALFYSTGKTLLSVSPIPSNELAIISYSLSQKTSVTLVIHDMTGKIMATINEGVRETGEYTTPLNSSIFPNGAYLLQLITDAGVIAQNSIIVFH